ncbi:MAG: zinc metallopeptidase [Actinobacteria bacterium]|nr:zinc metallopeptidase [Actinomycetota bacterium]
MRWRPGRGSGQIEDRRGSRGLGVPVGIGGGGLGIAGLLVYLLLSALGGGSGAAINPPLDQFPAMPGPSGGELAPENDPDRRLKDFVAFVVDDVQDNWERVFKQSEQPYRRTTLVLFRQATTSGCGPASAATGPFYCPLDGKVYLDLEFFRELSSRFGAPGDFAQAYVIAHEFGHHVQNVLGIDDQVRKAQRSDPDEANDLSVRLELQADCFAGVWGHSAYQKRLLESGDLEEGLAAAAAVGDDRIQRTTRGRVDPEAFTHGSSEQRSRWFREGFDRGDPNACDTFKGDI